MDFNQNGWASATPKSVANDDEIKAPTHMQAYRMQWHKPKAQQATLQDHWKDEAWSTMACVLALKWHITWLQNDSESCKQLTQRMLNGSSIETSEVHYTIGMQSDAQMMKPTPNRPYVGPKQ